MQVLEATVRPSASQSRHALLGGSAIDIKQSSLLYVGVAQLVERGTHKPEVTGSFPVADTIGSISENICGRSSTG